MTEGSGADPNATLGSHVASRGAWLVWLETIRRDEGCAIGAAHAYRELGPNEREAFLSALEEDASKLTGSWEFVILPFLTVEIDSRRRARLVAFLMRERASCRARIGESETAELFVLETSGMRATIYVYKDALREIDVDLGPAPSDIHLQRCDFDETIDRLALAVVRRHHATGRRSESLTPFAHLFGVARND